MLRSLIVAWLGLRDQAAMAFVQQDYVLTTAQEPFQVSLEDAQMESILSRMDTLGKEIMRTLRDAELAYEISGADILRAEISNAFEQFRPKFNFHVDSIPGSF